MPKEKVCRTCRRVVESGECAICKSDDTTNKWRGVIVIIDTESEIAKQMEITMSGRYAIELK